MNQEAGYKKRGTRVNYYGCHLKDHYWETRMLDKCDTPSSGKFRIDMSRAPEPAIATHP
jgi:hypothetical protein